MAYVIPLAERQLYGADTAVATNNPQALARHGHRLRKLTYVCDNPEFAKCWTEGLRPAVLRVIEALVPKGETTWILHVVRLGFVDPEVDKSLCPITLQLIVYPAISMEDDDVDVFPEKLAGELVHALGNVLEMYWDGEEKVYVDIGRRPVLGTSRVCMVRADRDIAPGCRWVDQSRNSALLYDKGLPLPGSSIGIEGFAATLTGYIMHRLPSGKSEYFALTCRHVVDQRVNIGQGGLVTANAVPVSSPQPGDHRVTKYCIAEMLRSIQEMNPAPSTMFGSILKKVGSFLLPDIGDYWLKALKLSEKYNIDFSHVYAASSTRNPAPDWLLVSIDQTQAVRSKYLNLHYPIVDHDDGSGFRDPTLTQLLSNHGRDLADAHLNRYFSSAHLPIRETPLQPSELVFKHPSRTTQVWTASKVNGIESIIKPVRESDMVISQTCLVSLDVEDPLPRHVPQYRWYAALEFKQGDAGALIFDTNFRPVAMISGTGMTMTANLQIQTVNPLAHVCRDIEQTLDWKRGSVHWK